MADKAHILTDKKLEEMERRLAAIYASSESELTDIAEEYFSAFEEADEKKRKQLDDGEITEEEYRTWRQQKFLRGELYKKMQEDVAKKLLAINALAVAYINKQLPGIYAANYNQLAVVLNHVVEYTFEITDANTVRLLSNTNKSLLPYKKLDPTKDIPWNMKNINREVMQGIVNGESIPKISKRMRNVQVMNREQSVRTARTVVTGAENKGRMDSYEKAEEDGVVLQKKWISTSDSRTRHWHSELDGVVVDYDDPFVNEYGEIMYPGDPSAHPANVYNCRCTMAAVVTGFKKVRK